MVLHTIIPSQGLEVKAEDKEFKVMLIYIASLKPDWAT